MKNIVICGLGQYPQGSGIAAALYFAKKKDNVLVSDFYYTPAMDKNVARLKKFKNVRFLFNTHPLEEISLADLVIRHQRMRKNEPEMIEAEKRNIPVETAESLFMKLCPCPVIGITGTRGKSTTTTLVAKMLEASRKHVWLGGNILVSPLMFLDKVQKKDLVVLELSSFQLEGTGAAGISPHIACWTNLMRDHLNAYPSMVEYAEAKAQILRHQTGNDVVVLNGDDKITSAKIKTAPGRVLVFTAKKSKRSDAWLTEDALMIKSGEKEVELIKKSKLRIHGEHNYANMLAAALTAQSAGASLVGMRKALVAFKGLEHRQEIVAVKKGVTYINDTTATTPDGAIAALRAFSAKNRTIRLIIGGADKELEFADFAKELKRSNVDVVVLPGTAYAKLTGALHAERVAFEDVLTLREAVHLLKKRAKPGDVLLLSPACASFGLFQNEFDRGEQFKKLVGKK